MQLAASALDFAWLRTGKRSPARMAMIAITTSNSIKVKPKKKQLLTGCAPHRKRVSCYHKRNKMTSNLCSGRLVRAPPTKFPNLRREMPALVLRPTACLISAQAKSLGLNAPVFLQANGLLHKVRPTVSTFLNLVCAI